MMWENVFGCMKILSESSAVTTTVSGYSETSSKRKTQESNNSSEERELQNTTRTQSTEQAEQCFRVLSTFSGRLHERAAREFFYERAFSNLSDIGERIRLILEKDQSEVMLRIANCVNATLELLKNESAIFPDIGSMERALLGLHEDFEIHLENENIFAFEALEVLFKPMIQLHSLMISMTYPTYASKLSYNEDRLD